jgi:hypothetical protein
MHVLRVGNKIIQFLTVTEDNYCMGITIDLFFTMNHVHGQYIKVFCDPEVLDGDRTCKKVDQN